MNELSNYGITPSMLEESKAHNASPARVTAVHRDRCELICENGTLYGKLKTGTYYSGRAEQFPTVGDFVMIDMQTGGDAQIIATLPRKTSFVRRDPDPVVGDQIVAANFDYVFIMTSLNRDFNVSRIERYVVLSRQSGAIPVVILTKADLVEDYSAHIAAVRPVAGDAGIIPVSVVSGMGINQLEDFLLQGVTVVFMGMSGVGKSSLLNALIGHEAMTVKEIREEDSRGRHTTTHRQLFMLPSGAMVIDTPGMRTIGLFDAEDGLGETFGDVEAFLSACRFSDCRHENEPGCAIRAAIVDGSLPPWRWESYNKLQREAVYAESKSDFMRRKQARNRDIAIRSRRREKHDQKKMR